MCRNWEWPSQMSSSTETDHDFYEGAFLQMLFAKLSRMLDQVCKCCLKNLLLKRLFWEKKMACIYKVDASCRLTLLTNVGYNFTSDSHFYLAQFHIIMC